MGARPPPATEKSHLLVRVNKDEAKIYKAKIYIDGTLRGVSPLGALSVQPGDHVVSVSLSGYIPWTDKVKTEEGQVKEVVVTLKRKPMRHQPVPMLTPGTDG